AALKRSFEAEKQSASRFASLKQASEAKNYEAVMTAFKTIPDASLYKDRSRPLHEAAQSKYVAMHLEAAERDRTASNCNDAKREAGLVLHIDATNKAAQEIVSRCNRPEPPRKPLAAAPAPRPAPRATAGRPTGRTYPAATSAGSASAPGRL